MSALELVFMHGEYSHYKESVPEIRHCIGAGLGSHDACRRFLIRIIARAVLDVSLYDEGDPLHDNARRWLLNDGDFLVTFRELVELVGMEELSDAIHNVAQEEGVHRQKVRNMKGLLYKLSENDGEGQPS